MYELYTFFKAAYKMSGFDSYEELAEAADVSDSTVRKFMCGIVTDPKFSTTAALASAINLRAGSTLISIDSLIGGD